MFAYKNQNIPAPALLLCPPRPSSAESRSMRPEPVFHFYGHSDLNVSYETSAQYYRVAANLRNPQSMFNLGHMHQYGIGIPQDFHLAKRHYDQALQSAVEAWAPVRLALIELQVLE